MENMAMFMLKDQEKLDFDLVPYKGGAPSLAAALGGHTHGFIGVTEAVPHIRDGSMRGLAVFSAERLPGLPEIPTLKESGYDVVIESRQVIYGPPGIPKDIVKRLDETLRKAMDSEDFKKVAKSFELIPSYLDNEDLDRYRRDLSGKIRTILIKVGRIKE
jgi:tripartite-type tricarboxylate transporter receptor subunit TctC